jgi:DNA-binding response OmpR family regulator
MAAKILLVEDEATIARALVDLLTGKGYDVEHAATGDAGRELGLAGGHAIALLDVMLPGVDGFTLCRALREAHPRLGICMLTAKGGEGDILEGFRAGADDYVPKPFSIAQLLARVEALVRRVGASESPFDIGNFRVDPARLRADRGACSCDLVRRDVELLAVLARADGAVVPRSVLLGDVWGYARPDAVESRCVDMHVVKLRRRLADAFGAEGEQMVETVRGEGYRLRGSRT